jgi:hypothetical protein
MKNNKEYLDKIVNIIEKPYFYELGLYGISDREEIIYVLSKVYGFDINFYYSGGNFNKIYILNKNLRQLYYEDNNCYISEYN